jgi:hypothetical protein
MNALFRRLLIDPYFAAINYGLRRYGRTLRTAAGDGGRDRACGSGFANPQNHRLGLSPNQRLMERRIVTPRILAHVKIVRMTGTPESMPQDARLGLRGSPCRN